MMTKHRLLSVTVILVVLILYGHSVVTAAQFSDGVAYEISWSSDGRSVAVATDDKVISIYSGDFELRAEFTPAANSVDTLDLSSDGKFLAASLTFAESPPRSAVYVWDVATGIEIAHFSIAAEESLPLEWNEETHLLAFVDADRQVSVWDRTTNLITQLQGQSTPTELIWRTDDTLIIVDLGGSIRIWEISTRVEQTIATQEIGFLAAALSPTGQLIATDYLGGTIRIWNLQTGAITTTLQGLPSDAYEISWSEHGIASVGIDGEKIVVWDADTGYILSEISASTKIRDMEWIPHRAALSYTAHTNDGLPTITEIATVP